MSVYVHLLGYCLLALGLDGESYFDQWDFIKGLDLPLYFVCLHLLLRFTETCLGLPAGGRAVTWHRAILS